MILDFIACFITADQDVDFKVKSVALPNLK